MKRSRQRNKFNLDPPTENWNNLKHERNICNKILKENNKEYFNNISIKNICDNKKFWRTIKPFFTDKNKSGNNIILTENDRIINDDQNIANILVDHFTNITKKLNLRNGTEISFENEESYKVIKEKFGNEHFNFQEIQEQGIIKAIKALPSNKATISEDIPTSILKNCIHSYSGKLTSIFNHCLRSGDFPSKLKHAEITPVFKKGDSTSKENYRPISTLSNFSKVFERLIHNQINDYMENKFSVFLTGFRKNHNTQHALLRMPESWKSKLNKGYKVGSIIMDLSKAFDTLNHKLLIEKLKSCKINNSLVLILFPGVLQTFSKAIY